MRSDSDRNASDSDGAISGVFRPAVADLGAIARVVGPDPKQLGDQVFGAQRTLINSSPDTLRAALLKEAGADRGPITIRADARTTHQAVVTAMDVAGRLGFAQLNIATVHEDKAP